MFGNVGTVTLFHNSFSKSGAKTMLDIACKFLVNSPLRVPGLFLFSRTIKVEVYDWDRDGR